MGRSNVKHEPTDKQRGAISSLLSYLSESRTGNKITISQADVVQKVIAQKGDAIQLEREKATIRNNYNALHKKSGTKGWSEISIALREVIADQLANPTVKVDDWAAHLYEEVFQEPIGYFVPEDTANVKNHDRSASIQFQAAFDALAEVTRMSIADIDDIGKEYAGQYNMFRYSGQTSVRPESDKRNMHCATLDIYEAKGAFSLPTFKCRINPKSTPANDDCYEVEGVVLPVSDYIYLIGHETKQRHITMYLIKHGDGNSSFHNALVLRKHFEFKSFVSRAVLVRVADEVHSGKYHLKHQEQPELLEDAKVFNLLERHYLADVEENNGDEIARRTEKITMLLDNLKNLTDPDGRGVLYTR